MNALLKLYFATICFCVLGFSNTQAQSSSFSTKKDPARYEYQLSQLNAFLEDFDEGNSGQISVENDLIVINYPEGQYCKFKIADMADPVLDTRWNQISWDCINESPCVESTWTDDGRETGVMFSELLSTTTGDLMELLTDFIRAYKGK